MINKVILMGRLVADPELYQSQSGVSSCKFRIAADRPYKFAGGEKQTDFILCVAWRNTAEFVSRYFSKGKMIIVEGSIQNNDYTDNNGVKHYSMIVKADNVSFGGDKKADDSPPPAASQTTANHAAVTDIGSLGDFEEILNDNGEVPF